MHEPSMIQRLVREKALSRYLTALEHGDIDTIIVMLARAESDPLLERMILEAHEGYETEEEFLTRLQEEDTMGLDKGVYQNKPLSAGQQPEFKPEYLPERKRRRSARWLQVLAAVLLVACIVGGFQAYQHLGKKSSTITINPANATLCVVPGAPQPSPDTAATQLYNVIAISPDDVWANGETTDMNTPIKAIPFLERWDGKSWSIVPTANADALVNSETGGAQGLNTFVGFSDLVALSADNIWAVGNAGGAWNIPGAETHWPTPLGSHTLIEHWNGSQWQIVPSPDGQARDSTGKLLAYNTLLSISAVSASDIWAVGYQSPENDSPYHSVALLEHWDGKSWTLVSFPASLQNGVYANEGFSQIEALSANDIWVFGASLPIDDLYFGDAWSSLAAHWNGKNWTTMDQPNRLMSNSIQSEVINAQNDIWATNIAADRDDVYRAGVSSLMHWDGRQWKTITQINGVAPGYILDGLRTYGPRDIWAVGDTADNQVLLAHWNGQNWSGIRQKQQQTVNSSLFDVAVNNGRIWAVGSVASKSDPQRLSGPLIETNC